MRRLKNGVSFLLYKIVCYFSLVVAFILSNVFVLLNNISSVHVLTSLRHSMYDNILFMELYCPKLLFLTVCLDRAIFMHDLIPYSSI